MGAGGAPPALRYPVRAPASHRPRPCHDPRVSDPARRHPAWLWYGLAATVLVALALLDLLGVLDPLGP
jgi:hypothetical protein